MEFVPKDGRGLHFQLQKSRPVRGPMHLEVLGSNVDVVPRRTTLRGCKVLRSNTSFPNLKRETPILVELLLTEDAATIARKILQCLKLQDSGAEHLIREVSGGLGLLVTAPSFYYNRWSRQEARLDVWGPGILDVGSTVDVVVDGLIRSGDARVALRETL